MPDILIVAATKEEAGFLIKYASDQSKGPLYSIRGSVGFTVDLLITGPGIAATIYWLTKQLMSKNYQLVLNIGICGSLNPQLKPGRLTQIISDRFGDFGVEDKGSFMDAFEMGLLPKNTVPFKNGVLKGNSKYKLACLQAISKSEGITVQKVTGSSKSAKQLFEKYGPAVESMEGAAFFYVCLQQQVSCLQIRAVSNKVQVRDRSSWKTKQAIDSLEGLTGLLLLELENRV